MPGVGMIKRRFFNPVVDDGLVESGPAEWNDSLVIDGGAAGDVLVRDSAADDGWAWKAGADFADAAHDHDGVYSPLGHNHDATYSLLAHDHAGVYSPIVHDHDGVYVKADGSTAGYVGQASITTLGTIATGVWSGTAVAANKGGTGQTVYAVGDLFYASATKPARPNSSRWLRSRPGFAEPSRKSRAPLAVRVLRGMADAGRAACCQRIASRRAANRADQGRRVEPCPPEQREAMEEALRHFGLI